MSDINKIIDEIVQEKTFSLDGLEAVKKLRDHANRLEGDLKLANELLKKETEKRIEVEKELDECAKELVSTNKSLQAYIERANKIVEHETNAAVAKAESAAYKYAMETVFRPNTIRESIHKSVPVTRAYSGGCECVEAHQQSETIVKEEG